MKSFNDIFAAETVNAATETSRSLAGTARLTQIASSLASDFMAVLQTIDPDDISMAMHDNDKLDKLIEQNVAVCMTEDDSDFFILIDSKTADGMLKSQQSKRSRLKSKPMTEDNFRNLVTAAIAEQLLRDVYDKPKHSSGGNRKATAGYTEEELELLAADQEALKKAIRNVQSKKSIAKAKAGFDPQSDYWLQLCETEEQLKARRVTAQRKSSKVDDTKTALQQLLTGVDINTADAQALLSQILLLTSDNNAE